MNRPAFDSFFHTGTDNTPYAYQSRLAGDDSGVACNSQIISVPTGLGKTAAVVLSWLWNRIHLQNPNWPRRLIYCLPMRTLVEQTRDETGKWIKNLATAFPENKDLQWLAAHSPIILMGGEDAGDWDIHPERPAILIGTQDMLLSRALNRGYGMSRYRWPMHFGLLNNDSLWILDETQLMGVSVETSAQLDGFRHITKWANAGRCLTWWMSATMDENRLATIDHQKPDSGWPKIELSAEERTFTGVRERFEARKPVEKAEYVLTSATKDDHAKTIADLIKQKHVPGTLTLVVVNRVVRARKLYAALRDKKLGLDATHIALIHSRFRPEDRTRHTKLLFGTGDRIVIATQAVEAGVDVSARLLIAELAPWSSLVQRIGRCNRKGELNDTAGIIWIDIQPKDDKDELLLPYSSDDLKKSRETINGLSDAGPCSLASIHVPETPVIRPVLRRRDLIDLFDTTPDICGQDLDISRYIRDGDDSDVQFFWRTIVKGSEPSNDEKPPRREELCRVSIGEAQKFIGKQSTRAWQWNSLKEEWQTIKHARPGVVCLVDATSGGYDDDLGWTGEPKNIPTPYPPPTVDADAQGKDMQTFGRDWVLLDKHAQGVVSTANDLASLCLDANMINVLGVAALWHDVGKAHEEFQKVLRFGPNQPEEAESLYAKSKNAYNPKALVRDRRGFRHELASALAWLSVGPENTPERDLVAYLIAAHHGKVRLSIRALPDEKGDPKNPDRLFARGIWHEDKLPAIPGILAQSVTLDLKLMQMGESESGPSWLARMISLRDRFGPFWLAYLEALLRAADMRTSRNESERLGLEDCLAQSHYEEKPKEA